MKKISLLVVLFYSIASFSQDITGEWYGKISVTGSELRLSFTISKNENNYSGTMSVPQQNANGIPLSSVTFVYKILVAYQIIMIRSCMIEILIFKIYKIYKEIEF